MHHPTTILMIRPVAFGFNPQTSESNAFQKVDDGTQDIQAAALREFDQMVSLLEQYDVDVIVIEDTNEPVKPDAVFPNNWVSFHETGDVLLYPMQAENRRLERREEIINTLKNRFIVRHIIDLSRFESQHLFLEGTGSMVLDRQNRIAYACLSPRTNRKVLEQFCNYTSYSSVCFNAIDGQGTAILLIIESITICRSTLSVILSRQIIAKASPIHIITLV